MPNIRTGTLPLWGGNKSELKKQIEEYGLQESIHLLPPTRTIGQEYQKSSLYVMSSRYEGLPLVLLEAMSYGLPLVSFGCPCGPKDIIKPEFGTLVECYDVNALAEAIMTWIGDRIMLLSGSCAARNEVQRYLRDNVMSRWDELFKRIAAGN